MQTNHFSKNLFQIQTELVDLKVDKAVYNSIDRVVQQIVELRSELKNDIADLRNEMHQEMSALRTDIQNIDKRLIAVETKLGLVNDNQREIRTRLLDYGFKAAWLILGIVALVIFHIH